MESNHLKSSNTYFKVLSLIPGIWVFFPLNSINKNTLLLQVVPIVSERFTFNCFIITSTIIKTPYAVSKQLKLIVISQYRQYIHILLYSRSEYTSQPIFTCCIPRKYFILEGKVWFEHTTYNNGFADHSLRPLRHLPK